MPNKHELNDSSAKSATGFVANLASLFGSIVLALCMAELLFRVYEDRFLVDSVNGAMQAIDLTKMHFNDTTITSQKPSHEFRILSMGDSFAHGVVTYPHTYHGVAQRILNERNQKMRIVNLGEHCTSFPRYEAVYNFFGKRLQHDAAIFNISWILQVAKCSSLAAPFTQFQSFKRPCL